MVTKTMGINFCITSVTAGPQKYSAESEPRAPVVDNNRYGKHDLHKRDISHRVHWGRKTSDGQSGPWNLPLHDDGEMNLQTGTSTTKYKQQWNLYDLLKSLDHGELPLRNESECDDDRDDELQLWNRQTVFCTVWTMTPLIAHQRAFQRPCPRTAPVNLHITVLWSMPAMMTGILGLRQPRGAQHEGHRQIPANQALHMPKKSFWSIPAMMSSILGLSSTDGNTAHQKKKSEERNPCPQRRIRTPEEDLGSFLLLSSSSSAWTKRMPKRDFRSAASPSPSCRRGAAPTTGPSSRARDPPSPAPPSSSSPSSPPLSSCPQQHVGRGRRALCRQRRRHQRAPAQQGEELPLRRAARCGHSSAAPGQRDCRAAPPEVVSSVPVGRRCASCTTSSPMWCVCGVCGTND